MINWCTYPLDIAFCRGWSSTSQHMIKFTVHNQSLWLRVWVYESNQYGSVVHCSTSAASWWRGETCHLKLPEMSWPHLKGVILNEIANHKQDIFMKIYSRKVSLHEAISSRVMTRAERWVQSKNQLRRKAAPPSFSCVPLWLVFMRLTIETIVVILIV